jgi:hypothetical protein
METEGPESKDEKLFMISIFLKEDPGRTADPGLALKAGTKARPKDRRREQANPKPRT